MLTGLLKDVLPKVVPLMTGFTNASLLSGDDPFQSIYKAAHRMETALLKVQNEILRNVEVEE